MENLEQDTKQCPFCGGEIKSVAIKCKHCGKFLNQGNNYLQENKTISINISDITKYAKDTGRIISVVAIFILLIWTFFFDYTAATRNHDNFWYGQYLTAAIEHTLLAIFFVLVLMMLKK